MGLIQILSPGLVNRIAAGECVERPASVVKELLENALDAGAARIDIHIEDGGRALIRVSDDGRGMDADDLRLCVTPHATSKIRDDDDLFNIHTLGFRGEALPSIASVSRMRITSRLADNDAGSTIFIDAGELRGPEPAGAAPGTTVEVRDLFCNVPARRRFLRTTQTETGHITEQLARIALAHPAIAFSLTHGKRKLHRLAATDDRRKRIGDFYGAELADVLIAVHGVSEGLRIDGLVGPPSEARASSKWEYIFLNGRYVRDRFVSHAVKEAYRSLIQPRTYPVAFIFITVDPAQIDINVHPTKTEVRWRNSNLVHAQVLGALRDKFLKSNLDRPLRTPVDQEAYRERVRDAMVDFFTSARPGGHRERTTTEARRHGADAETLTAGGVPRSVPSSVSTPVGGNSGDDQYRATDSQHAGRESATEQARSSDAFATDRDESQSAPSLSFQDERAAGRSPFAGPANTRAIQIHNTYLVVETDDGLMIIDQHALHERVIYEQLRRRIAESSLESQRLLIPDVLRVAPDRMEALETHAETLVSLGVELQQSGPQSVSLLAFPSLLERVDRPKFVRDLLDMLAEHGTRPRTETLIHGLLDMMACKAAVKAGDTLTLDEIRSLLASREVAERSSHCPHGRPTTLHLTLRDLERQFKRR